MTAPGSCPWSTSLLNADVRWARRSGEKPTCSGRATGRGWPQTTAAERTSITETASASTFFMGAPPARSGWDGRDATSARWHGKPLEAPVRHRSGGHQRRIAMTRRARVVIAVTAVLLLSSAVAFADGWGGPGGQRGGGGGVGSALLPAVGPNGGQKGPICHIYPGQSPPPPTPGPPIHSGRPP